MDKPKKIIIIFNAAYTLFSIAYVNEDRVFHFSRITSFIILMIPVFLYWSGVWIFGFGYIFSFMKKHKRFFRNIFLLSILFCLIFKIASGYKLPTKLERKQGCFVLHNTDNATCFNGKEYENSLLKRIINKENFMLHTKDCSVGYATKKRWGIESFTIDYYDEIIRLSKELESKGYTEAADVLSLKDEKKVRVKENRNSIRFGRYSNPCEISE
ncbi:MAG: hypothetical protein IJ752_06040 [Alphaproteobacteria bacterium]|nr:hypothetical protein [Alphaproteobacteria bacterium]